jgi:hypothetical protein
LLKIEDGCFVLFRLPGNRFPVTDFESTPFTVCCSNILPQPVLPLDIPRVINEKGLLCSARGCVYRYPILKLMGRDTDPCGLIAGKATVADFLKSCHFVDAPGFLRCYAECLRFLKTAKYVFDNNVFIQKDTLRVWSKDAALTYSDVIPPSIVVFPADPLDKDAAGAAKTAAGASKIAASLLLGEVAAGISILPFLPKTGRCQLGIWHGEVLLISVKDFIVLTRLSLRIKNKYGDLSSLYSQSKWLASASLSKETAKKAASAIKRLLLPINEETLIDYLPVFRLEVKDGWLCAFLRETCVGADTLYRHCVRLFKMSNELLRPLYVNGNELLAVVERGEADISVRETRCENRIIDVLFFENNRQKWAASLESCSFYIETDRAEELEPMLVEEACPD